LRAAAWRGIASYLMMRGQVDEGFAALQVIVETADPVEAPRALRNIGAAYIRLTGEPFARSEAVGGSRNGRSDGAAVPVHDAAMCRLSASCTQLEEAWRDGLFNRQPQIPACDMCSKTEAEGCGSADKHVAMITVDEPTWLPVSLRTQAGGEFTWTCTRCNS
jgi:hypothetical protein